MHKSPRHTLRMIADVALPNPSAYPPAKAPAFTDHTLSSAVAPGAGFAGAKHTFPLQIHRR